MKNSHQFNLVQYILSVCVATEEDRFGEAERFIRSAQVMFPINRPLEAPPADGLPAGDREPLIVDGVRGDIADDPNVLSLENVG